jgi:hypothetical protein
MVKWLIVWAGMLSSRVARVALILSERHGAGNRAELWPVTQ